MATDSPSSFTKPPPLSTPQILPLCLCMCLLFVELALILFPDRSAKCLAVPPLPLHLHRSLYVWVDGWVAFMKHKHRAKDKTGKYNGQQMQLVV